MNSFEGARMATNKEQESPLKTHMEEQEGVLIPEQALEEEKGLLRNSEQPRGGTMRGRVMTALLLGSMLVFGAGTSDQASGQAREGPRIVETEGTHPESAEKLIQGLVGKAKEEVPSSVEGYAANKHAALAEIEVFILAHKDRKAAIGELVQEANNPALLKFRGIRDALRMMIGRYRSQ